MPTIRIGVIGTTPTVEWAILPVLIGADAVSPPDTGAWWSRRPAPSGDIRYQAPATPEIVALCDFPEPKIKGKPRPQTPKSPRLETLARQFRVAATYPDPLQMLREQPLDAVFLAHSEELRPAQLAALMSRAPGMQNGVAPPRWLWIDGPPAPSLADLNAFAAPASGLCPALWMSFPLRRAAAHRAARRLLERDEIGPVTAIQARFAFPFDPSRFELLYGAFDLLLSFVPAAQMPREVLAARHGDGATSLLVRFAGGASLTALFAAGDTWNAPLPRVEVCGTQGRFLVCESGRKLTLFIPRDGARVWEPPGLAPHLSSANLSGYGEDIKAFLAICNENPAPWSAERALDEAARALSVLESSFVSLESGLAQPIAPRGVSTASEILETKTLEAPANNLTLDLS